jgi:hypothetical protein
MKVGEEREYRLVKERLQRYMNNNEKRSNKNDCRRPD